MSRKKNTSKYETGNVAFITNHTNVVRIYVNRVLYGTFEFDGTRWLNIVEPQGKVVLTYEDSKDINIYFRELQGE